MKFEKIVALGVAFAIALSSASVLATPVERYWRGTDATKPTLASVAANWKDSTLPADGDCIVIDEDSANKPMTWNLSISPGGWTQTNYTGTVTFDRGTNTVVISGDVDLASGTWTHPANPSFTASSVEWKSGRGSKQLVVKATGDFIIRTDATIDVTGKGFQSKQGPGQPDSVGVGASHGGTSAINTMSKNCKKGYGSARRPVTIGSGGNNGSADWSSTGGGAVYISTSKSLTVNGTILANGGAKNAKGNMPLYYAGAGGSVLLEAEAILGSGTVRAGGTQVSNASAGGGGRVAVRLSGTSADFTSFTGTLSAPRGEAPDTAAGAFAGTVYLEKKSDSSHGELLVDGAGANTTNLDLPKMGNYGTYVGNETTQHYSRITLKWPAQLVIPSNVLVRADAIVSENAASYTNRVVLRGGTLELPEHTAVSNYILVAIAEGSRLGFFKKVGAEIMSVTNTTVIEAHGLLEVDRPFVTVTNLEVRAGGAVTHVGGVGYNGERFKVNLVVPGDIWVRAGGMIHARGRGYSRYEGTGWSSYAQTGASHGGNGWGGHASWRVGNGLCYGSVRYPVSYGSGGNWNATEGGGVIRVTASGTIRNDGTINADAATCDYHSGSGGSVWLTAAKMTGGGGVSANGGYTKVGGGSGSGGRVAVYLTGIGSGFDDYSGQITAYGGCEKGTTVRGAAGTVYLETAAQGAGNGALVINNGTQAADNDTSTRISDDVTDAVVGDVRIVGTRSRLTIADGHTLSFSGVWTNAARFVAEAGSTVVCRDATRRSEIFGENDFCNFTCQSPGKTLAFSSVNSFFAIYGGVLTLCGEENNPLALVPVEKDATWRMRIGSDSSSDVSYVAVTNSDATAGLKIVARNSFGNVDEATSNWKFDNIQKGVTNTWTGASSSVWADADNWSLGRDPADTDCIVIAAGGNSPIVSKPIVAMDLTIQSDARLYLSGSDVSVENLFVNGQLIASDSERIAVSKNASFIGGAVTSARSTLVLNGSGAQTFNPQNVSLYDVVVEKSGGSLAVNSGFTAERFRITASSPLTVTFASGINVTTHQTMFDGLVGDSAALTLASSISSTPWNLKATAYARANGVIVSDANASGGCAFVTRSPSAITRCENWILEAQSFVWTGAVDSDFTKDGNWQGGTAPGVDDSVTVTGPATITVPTTFAVRNLSLGGSSAAVSFRSTAALTVSGTFEVASNAVATLDQPVTIGGSMVVRDGGKVTHTANGSKPVYRLQLEIGNDLLIEAGGSIDVVGKGYAKGYGPGHGDEQCGASHGGLADGTPGICTIAPAYGSIFAPMTLGSGGHSHANYGSAGGGAVKVSAGGDVIIDGLLSVNGKDDLVCLPGASEYGYYSGAGGSIFIRAAHLQGIGRITADAGNVANYRPGGGGRVAVYLSAAESPESALTITAFGGRRIHPPDVNYPAGGAGTVYVQGASQPERGGTITVANDGGSNYTPLPVDDVGVNPYQAATVVVTDGGRLSLTNDVLLRDLDLKSSGRLYLNGHVLTLRSRAHRRDLREAEAAGRVVPAGGSIQYFKRGLMILAR